MDAVGCVDDAAGWASALVERERTRGEADPLAAVALQGRVTRYKIWSLLYRPPKSVSADVYLALGNLYEAECARQAARYSEERARTEAKTWLGRAMLRTADALADQEIGSVD